MQEERRKERKIKKTNKQNKQTKTKNKETTKKTLEKLEQGREGKILVLFFLLMFPYCFWSVVLPEVCVARSSHAPVALVYVKNHAETRDRTGDLQVFGLTLSQLSYRGLDLWTWPYAASL